MIKKTLYFGNPSYLSMQNKQLMIRLPEVENNDSLPETFKQESIRTVPIEDIGVIVLDHKQITITHGLMEALLANNCAIISCGRYYLYRGLYGALAYEGLKIKGIDLSNFGRIEVGYTHYFTTNVFFEPSVYFNKGFGNIAKDISNYGLTVGIGVNF